jgi:hypothetical protein
MWLLDSQYWKLKPQNYSIFKILKNEEEQRKVLFTNQKLVNDMGAWDYVAHTYSVVKLRILASATSLNRSFKHAQYGSCISSSYDMTTM